MTVLRLCSSYVMEEKVNISMNEKCDFITCNPSRQSPSHQPYFRALFANQTPGFASLSNCTMTSKNFADGRASSTTHLGTASQLPHWSPRSIIHPDGAAQASFASWRTSHEDGVER
jgi:hypothetical protein